MMAIGQRSETDFLGTKGIPEAAYYGLQTLRAIEMFPITGYRVHTSLIKGIAIVKKATALANVKIGVLDKQIGQAIVQATDEIIIGKLHDQFIVDPIQPGACASLNMNANEVIANRALEIIGREKGDYSFISPNTHVNMSQSTGDVFPTSFRLATLDMIDQLITTMRNMEQVIIQIVNKFEQLFHFSDTHLHDVFPIRLGLEFENYQNMIQHDIIRITNSKDQLFKIHIGTKSIGTRLKEVSIFSDLVVDNISQISGFQLKKTEQILDANEHTVVYSDVIEALKNNMINISKICNDLRLMSVGSNAGLYRKSLSATSEMSGQINPVISEIINHITNHVVGNDLNIGMSTETGKYGLHVMEPVLVFNLIQSINMMRNGFNVFTNYCLKRVEADEMKIMKNIERNVPSLTALTPYLGHEKTSQIARQAILTGKCVRAVCLKLDVLTEEQLDHILDPMKLKNPGVV
ncbi:lyase family protein [Cytobacillus sp. IB215316]|uniref:lyase family protein n=1 Tax=Cytobacillus sp. IB215316 TaxID=3097354 RepID=UPI0039B7880A